MDTRLKFPIFGAAVLLLATAEAARANDWYLVNSDNSGCTDVTQSANAAGTPQYGTPSDNAESYQQLGDNVTSTTLTDTAGAQIVFQHITDSSGNPFLNFTFFPSLADCLSFMNYAKAHEN